MKALQEFAWKMNRSSERKGIVEEIFRGIGHVRKIDENEMHDFYSNVWKWPGIFDIYFYSSIRLWQI